MVKLQQGPHGRICSRKYASCFILCFLYAAALCIMFDNTQASMMAIGTTRKRKQIVLLPIQLSEPFTYPNDNAFGDGQRGSDN